MGSSPVADADRGRDLMAEGAARLVEGVERNGAAWVVEAVTRLVDLWARLAPGARAETLSAAREAGDAAATRAATELRAFFALDPADQRTTPLAIIRSLRREATETLAAAGIPPIERDPYEVRSFPDDVYGIVPKSPADLGDDERAREELGGALLAWGMGKAAVLRARAADTQPD